MKKEHLKKAAALSMAVMMAAGSLVIPGTTAKAASETDHSEEITITMMTAMTTTMTAKRLSSMSPNGHSSFHSAANALSPASSASDSA